MVFWRFHSIGFLVDSSQGHLNIGSVETIKGTHNGTQSKGQKQEPLTAEGGKNCRRVRKEIQIEPLPKFHEAVLIRDHFGNHGPGRSLSP
jgi:hypothetical protein